MINEKLLKGIYISKGFNQSSLAKELEITPNTLRRKIKKEKLEIREVDKLIDLLEIKNPLEIFFAQEIT